MKTISNEGLKLIKTFEGCRLVTYDDLQPNVTLNQSSIIKGTLTIGWGHTGSDVTIGKRITQDQADKLLLSDLTKYILYVNNNKNVPFFEKLNQNQFDALVSFCYNTGQSNLRQLCENRTISEIPRAMLLYNKSKGKVLEGLNRRRQAERQLFIKPITSEPIIVQPPQSNPNNPESRIKSLEDKVNLLTISLGNQQALLEPIDPPEWFKKEFPDILNLIHTKTGTMEFWRAVAVSIRSIRNKS